MFTAFMVALTLTTVANVLVTMAVSPFLTALMARIGSATGCPRGPGSRSSSPGLGIAWMYGAECGRRAAAPGRRAGGAVRAGGGGGELDRDPAHARGSGRAQDMLPAVLIGAVLSAALALPLALPLAASAHDLGLLALLGVVQLAIPCLLAVALARVLSAPEISLLALLEVVFGVAWAWLGAGEAPSASVLGGGALVLAALAANEAAALRMAGPREGAGAPG